MSIFKGIITGAVAFSDAAINPFFLPPNPMLRISQNSLAYVCRDPLPIAIGGLPAPDQLIKFRELLKREHERPPLLHRLVRLIPVRLHRGRQGIFFHTKPPFWEDQKTLPATISPGGFCRGEGYPVGSPPGKIVTGIFFLLPKKEGFP